jgi:hypothetical protein
MKFTACHLLVCISTAYKILIAGDLEPHRRSFFEGIGELLTRENHEVYVLSYGLARGKVEEVHFDNSTERKGKYLKFGIGKDWEMPYDPNSSELENYRLNDLRTHLFFYEQSIDSLSLTLHNFKF